MPAVGKFQSIAYHCYYFCLSSERQHYTISLIVLLNDASNEFNRCLKQVKPSTWKKCICNILLIYVIIDLESNNHV